MDKSIPEKFSVVKSRAQSIKLSRVWFEWFIDLINAGWHKQYTFLGETYTFSSLSEFVEHKDGLEADPIAMYLAVEACSKNSEFNPFASQLMKVFHEEGFDPVVKNVKQVNNAGRPKTIDPREVKELRGQGLTQKRVAEELGCTQHRISQIENISNCDNITIIDNTPKTDSRGTSQEYLLRKIKTSAPDLIPEIGKGKKYPSARAAAITAGIIKPKISFQVSPDESGASIASKLYQKLTKDQLIELTAQLTSLVLENDND